MIQLEKIIERGEQDIDGGNLRWLKFADGTYLMGGCLRWDTTSSSDVFEFTVNLPISISSIPESVVVVTNVYYGRRICTWTAFLTAANQIRFDVKPAEATGAGITLACSFILFGR